MNRTESQSITGTAMSEKKPGPILSPREIKTCPVCKKPSYSREGIHPQCATIQADAARIEEMASTKKRDAADASPSSWNKKECPKCHVIVHVRQKCCECGHAFF